MWHCVCCGWGGSYNVPPSKAYNPSTLACVDESVVATRARTSKQVHLPRKKSASNGLRMFKLADSKSTYVTNVLLFYPGMYGGSKTGPNVVMDLLQPYKKQFFHVFLDNYFTSPALASTLLKDGKYVTGTVRKGCVGFPMNRDDLVCLHVRH